MDILIDVGDISMPESFVNSFVYVTYTKWGKPSFTFVVFYIRIGMLIGS